MDYTEPTLKEIVEWVAVLAATGALMAVVYFIAKAFL